MCKLIQPHLHIFTSAYWLIFCTYPMQKNAVWHSFDKLRMTNIHPYEKNHCAEHPDDPCILCSDARALMCELENVRM